MATKQFTKKKQAKKDVYSGKIYIKASYNNTIVTVADPNGNVLTWGSAGKAGFKGPKKATPYAAGVIVKDAITRAKDNFGLKEAYIYVRGVGSGREGSIRAINANGIIITGIKDVTPIPHNGCRPPGPRRL